MPMPLKTIMPTIAHSTRTSAAPLTRAIAQARQIREVQEAICEADNDDFATEAQVNAVFAKYGVPRRNSGDTKFDQILFNLKSDQFQKFTQILDAPAAVNQALSRLMAIQAPWAVAAS
jgi:Protein of unknown function (DUF1778)